MRNRNSLWVFGVIFLGALAMGCTEVDLYDSTQSSPTAEFNLVWPKENDLDKPDSLLIVGSRIINSWRTAMVTSSTSGHGNLLYPLTASEPPVNNWDKWPLRKGIFHFLATNFDSSVYSVSNVQEFNDNLKKTIKSITTSYKLYNLNSPQVLQTGESWIDKNSSADSNPTYISVTASKIYALQNDNVDIDLDTPNVVQLKAECITQHINLNFQVRMERDMTVQNILGDLSGIPISIHPAVGGFPKDQTCKIMIRPTVTDRKNIIETVTIQQTSADGIETSSVVPLDLLTLSASIDVISIIHNNQKTSLTGDGILSLGFDCTPAGGDKKTYYASINLYRTLLEQNPITAMGKVENVSLYKNKEQNLDLQISHVMTITKQGLAPTVGQNNRDTWTATE